jgi:hypothetical protein
MPSSHKGQKINRRSRPLRELFESKFVVDADTGCWLWQATLTKNGYGLIHKSPTGPDEKPRALIAHRVSYELYIGPIPDGLTIDHLCRVRHCVNPDHLEAVTLRENVLRGTNFSAINAAKTHCPQGHPYSGENLIITKGGRRCRECDRRRDRDRYYRNHAENLAKRKLKRAERKR